MIKRIVSVFAGLIVSFGILFVSIIKASSLVYQFNSPLPTSSETPSPTSPTNSIKMDYNLPGPGEIMPDNPLWLALAASDKMKIEAIDNPLDKAEVLLELADKRFSVACKLFTEGDYEESVLTFQKAEKYLEESAQLAREVRQGGHETKELLEKLYKASAYHRMDLEEHLVNAPEDARPVIVSIMDTPKRVFEDSRNLLTDLGEEIVDPFEV